MKLEKIVLHSLLILVGVFAKDDEERIRSGMLRGQMSRILGTGVPKVTKREWAECIGMMASDCATIVRRDAKRHEVPNLTVKVVVPRTAEEVQTTYMKVGIAVNVFGQVTGDKNDGQITYPFIWVSAENGKTRELGPWDCQGLDSWSCCRKIRLSVPDMDIHGNHIQCFAHENSLVPETRTDRPVYEQQNLAYYTFVYNKDSAKYEKAMVSPNQVKTIREAKNSTVAAAITSLDKLLGDAVPAEYSLTGTPATEPPQESITVQDLIQLEASLMNATTAIGDAQNLLGNIEQVIASATLGANIATIEHPTTTEQTSLATTEVPLKQSSLEEIMLAVRHKMYDYTTSGTVVEDYIWIYASHNGKIWRAPQIGGTFDGHEEYLQDIPGYEDYKLRYVSNLTKPLGHGARYLHWTEIDV